MASKAKVPLCILCFGNAVEGKGQGGSGGNNQNGKDNGSLDLLKKMLSKSLEMPPGSVNDLLIPSSSSASSSSARKNQPVLCDRCVNQVAVISWLYGELKDVQTKLLKEIVEMDGILEHSKRFLTSNPNLSDEIHQTVARQLNHACGQDGGQRVQRVRDLLAFKIDKEKTRFGYDYKKDRSKRKRPLGPAGDQRIVKVELEPQPQGQDSEDSPKPNQSGNPAIRQVASVQPVQVAGPSHSQQRQSQPQSVLTPVLMQAQNRNANANNAPVQNRGVGIGPGTTFVVGSNLVHVHHPPQQRQGQNHRRNSNDMVNPIVTRVFSLSTANGINSSGSSSTTPVATTSASASTSTPVASTSASAALASSSSMPLQPEIAATVPAPAPNRPKVTRITTARMTTGKYEYQYVLECQRRKEARELRRKERAEAKVARLKARQENAARARLAIRAGAQGSSAKQPKLATKTRTKSATPNPQASLPQARRRPRPLGLRPSSQIGRRSAEAATGNGSATGTVAVRRRAQARKTRKRNPGTASGVKTGTSAAAVKPGTSAAAVKPGTSAAAARKLKTLKKKKSNIKETGKKVQCPTCLKFISGGPYNLKTHQRVHSGVKPYACQKCGKHFTQMSSRNLHERQSCPMDKNKPSTSTGVAGTENQDANRAAATTPKPGGSGSHLDMEAATSSAAED